MENKSIQKNYIYNSLLTISNILLPLVTFSYVSRVLEPDGIGKVNLALSIVGYFVMLSQLGIPVYGIKEIAKVRDDNYKLSNTFSELLLVNSIMVLISLMLYLLLFLFVEKMQKDKFLFLVVGLNLLVSLFSIDWFYCGIEEYKYIALRNLVVKTFSIVLTFSLIHQKSDYIEYAGITVISLAISNIANMISLRKYLRISFSNISIHRHLKPMLILLMAGVIGSIYGNLDTILLGFIAGNKYVGFYTTSRKIAALCITIACSLGTVLTPRFSYYLNSHMNSKYNDLAEKSVNFIYFVSFPMIIFVMVMSKELIMLFGGEKFLPAGTSLQIISFQIFLTSLATFFGFQVLLANNDEKALMKSNISGAVVNLTLNLLLIKYFFHVATSLAIVVSELAVVTTQIILAKKYINFKIINRQSTNYFRASLLFLIVLILMKLVSPFNYIVSLIINGTVSIIIYGLFLFYKGDEFIGNVIYKISSLRKGGF